MLIDVQILFESVLLLLLMLIPGIILNKMMKGDKSFVGGLSKLVLYIAAPAMMISPFIREFDKEMLGEIIVTFFGGLVMLLIFYAVSMIIWGEEKVKRTLRFSIVFSNAGYMGIPLIEYLLGGEAVIYATVFNVAFNFLTWTLGCYIYTGDIKYMRPKKIITNPVVISMIVGLIIFFTPANRYIPETVASAIEMVKGLVAPISMMVVGYHAASANYKRVLSRGSLWLSFFLRLIVCPLLTFLVFKGLSVAGIFTSATVTTVMLIASATPSATATSMFAEMFSGDTEISGVAVPISTVLSLATMPLVAMVLNLY